MNPEKFHPKIDTGNSEKALLTALEQNPRDEALARQLIESLGGSIEKFITSKFGKQLKPEDIEEIVNTAEFQAIDQVRAGKFRREAAFKTLAIKIAENAALSLLRSRKVRMDDKHISLDDPYQNSAAAALANKGADTLTNLTQAGNRDLVLGIIGGLPRMSRRALLLAIEASDNSLTHNEIALREGINPNTFKTNLKRARLLLRGELPVSIFPNNHLIKRRGLLKEHRIVFDPELLRLGTINNHSVDSLEGIDKQRLSLLIAKLPFEVEQAMLAGYYLEGKRDYYKIAQEHGFNGRGTALKIFKQARGRILSKLGQTGKPSETMEKAATT